MKFYIFAQGFLHDTQEERYFMTPTPFQAFGIFSIMWFTNVSSESRVRQVVGDLNDSVYENR